MRGPSWLGTSVRSGPRSIAVSKPVVNAPTWVFGHSPSAASPVGPTRGAASAGALRPYRLSIRAAVAAGDSTSRRRMARQPSRSDAVPHATTQVARRWAGRRTHSVRIAPISPLPRWLEANVPARQSELERYVFIATDNGPSASQVPQPQHAGRGVGRSATG